MNSQRLRFPTDLAALLGVYWVILPITALGAAMFPSLLRWKNEGDLTLLWIAAAIGVAGSSLLFWARLPLYREHRFLKTGPRHLDQKHKRIYWAAWMFLFASFSMFGLLILFSR